MQKNEYHILNGDALVLQFPKSINGQKIIARECLVDGPVKAANLEELYEIREQFLQSNYGLNEDINYQEKSIKEFAKILNIELDSVINLWFEDDLFCQVNLWFVLHLLSSNNQQNTLYLVRPLEHSPYSFGHLSEEELVDCFNNKTQLNQIDIWNLLFVEYQRDNYDQLIELSKQLSTVYPFVELAVKAHIERISIKNTIGRPKESLLKIMAELKTKSFGPVFQEFCKKEAIYGFGDLQVKRLFDELMNEQTDK